LAAAVATLRLTVLSSAPATVPARTEPPVVSESAEPVIVAAPTVAAIVDHPPTRPLDPSDEKRVEWLRTVAGGEPAASIAPLPSSRFAPTPERPQGPPPAPDWLALARRAHIVLYTTGWCPVCRRAKAWLDANGLSYDDRDVDASSEDARALRRLNPRGSIPTFDVDGEVMVGFSEAGFVSVVRRAAASR
jgi:glutaredoxin 3